MLGNIGILSRSNNIQLASLHAVRFLRYSCPMIRSKCSILAPLSTQSTPCGSDRLVGGRGALPKLFCYLDTMFSISSLMSIPSLILVWSCSSCVRASLHALAQCRIECASYPCTIAHMVVTVDRKEIEQTIARPGKNLESKPLFL